MTETSRHAVSAWTPPQDRRRWGTADGRAMCEALRASGDSLRTFAQRHRLQEERVRRWMRRLDGTRPVAAPPAPPLAFAPVRLVEPPAEALALEVAVGGAVVRVRRGFDEALLRRVVGVLAEAPC